jgi:acetate kinase
LFTADREPRAIVRETIDTPAASGLPLVMEWIRAHADDRHLAAIGHRVVHGGAVYQQPQRITHEVVAALTRLIPFAPNHLPDEIALIEAFGRGRPDTPQVACFDTAFHRDLPEVARRLPIPRLYDSKGIRRYGFHGLSFAFLMRALERDGGTKEARGRVILAHLGNGSSLAAVSNGQGIDTTMGLTPIGGVPTSTRSGDLDPGVVTWIERSEGMGPDRLEDLLSSTS